MNSVISIRYVKKFAVLPVKCINQEVVWLHKYYVKYRIYTFGRRPPLVFRLGNITEADTIIEKLSGAD